MATGAATGILAEDHGGTRQQVIDLLTTAFWMQIETVMNDIADAVDPDGVRAQEIIASLREDAAEELGHAQRFATRIKEPYGVAPGSAGFTASQDGLQPPGRQTDIVHVIRGVIEAETRPIERHERIVEFTEGVDPVTNDMVIDVLHDEQTHRRLFEGFLREYEAGGRA